MTPGAVRWWCFALVTLLAARPAAAQLGCSGNSCTVEIRMPTVDVMRISVSTSSVSLGTPGEADYTAGFRDVAGAAVTATVKANRAYQVQVSGATPTFTYSGKFANPNKPASELKWATTQGGLAGTSNHMGTSAVLLNNKPGGPLQASLYLRTLWNFQRDVPGAYSMSVRLTVSAP